MISCASHHVMLGGTPLSEQSEDHWYKLESMQDLSNTNIKSTVFGRGVARGVAAEGRLGKFAVCTMQVPWSLARDVVGGAPVAVLMVESMEEHVLEQQLQSVPECDTFVGVGGGQAVDMAKYFSWRRGKRLVTIPTVISVDAFVTPSAAIRRDSEVAYVGVASPDPLVIDYDLIRTAPRELNIAGVGDILSIHTAVYDWELAEQRGKSEYPFSPSAVQNARSILAQVLSKADDIASMRDAGIQCIVDAYMAVNTICVPAGHYRVEEGSEHYVFYALEKRYQQSFIHGHVVGLGVYLMSRLQGNGGERIVQFMDSVGLKHRYLTSRNGIGNGRRAHYVPRCSGSAEAGYKSVTRYTSMIQDKQYFYRIYKCVYRLEVSALWTLFLILFVYKNTQKREENHQIIEVMTYAES